MGRDGISCQEEASTRRTAHGTGELQTEQGRISPSIASSIGLNRLDQQCNVLEFVSQEPRRKASRALRLGAKAVKIEPGLGLEHSRTHINRWGRRNARWVGVASLAMRRNILKRFFWCFQLRVWVEL